MPDVTITLKTIDQSSTVVKKVNQEFKSLAPGLEKATGNMGKFMSANAGLLSVMGGVAAGAFAVGKAVYASAKAYEESAKMGAKLQAVLKSTGGAAGQTVEGLNKMADALSKVSGVDDELIVNAEALLLTFTRVKDEAFAPTMQAALDMSAVLGGDLQGSVIQVGKAMNDFSGYAALKRAGVSFTAEQLTQIENFKKTNDLIGYQNLVLNELATEFGGAAKAMNDASLGGDNVKVAWGNLVEEIGESNAGWISDFNRGLAYTFDSFREWIDNMQDAAEQADKLAATQTNLVDIGRDFMKGQEIGMLAAKAYGAQIVRGREWTRLLTQAEEERTAVIEEQSAEMQTARANEISSAIQIQDANDKYNESQTKSLGIIASLKAEKEKLLPWERDEISKINEEIKAQEQAYAAGQATFGAAMAEKFALMAVEKIALSDGVEGYSEAEAEKARAILSTASIATQAAFEQVIAQETITTAVANGTMSLEEMHRILLIMQKGYTIDVAVNIQKQNLKNLQQELTTQTGGSSGQYGGAIGDDANGLASGGRLSSGWNLVGDKPGGVFVPGVSELIKDGRVYNSADSAQLINSGKVSGVKSYAQPDDDYSSGGAVNMPPVVLKKKDPGRRIGGSGDFVSDSSAVITSAIQDISMQASDMQSTTQAVIQQISIQFQNMTQQIIASNQQNANALNNIAGILQYANPQAVGKAVAYEVTKNS